MGISYGGVYSDVSKITGPSGWYWINTLFGPVHTYVNQDYDGGGWVLVLANRAGQGAMSNLTYDDAVNTCNIRTSNNTVVLPGSKLSTLDNYDIWVGTKFWSALAGRATSNTVSVFSDVRLNDGKIQIRSGNVARNTKWKQLETGTNDVGISFYNAADTWCMQLYAASYADSGIQYGFLNGNWANWDLRKLPNGNLYMNNNNSYYLNAPSDNYMYRVYGAADTRSPIFYDLDNTNFFLDPNASLSLNVAGSIRTLGYGNASSYVTFNNAGQYWGLIGNYGADDFRIGYGSYSSMTNWNMRWDGTGIAWSNVSHRAPIFYDSDNTGYYVDPTSTSNLNIVTVNGSLTTVGIYTGTGFLTFNDDTRNPNDSAHYPNIATRAVRFGFTYAGATGTGGNYSGIMHFSPWTGTTASTGDAAYQLAFGSTATNGSGNPQLVLRNGIDTTWNSWYYIPMYGLNQYTGSFYATIYYDSNNTSYYVDPASTSNLTTLQLAGTLTAINGYTPTNGAIRLTPNLHLNSVAGNAVILNWDNGTTGSAITFRIGNGAGSDVYVMYANGYSYQTNYAENISSYRAPVFYDYNNTAYYVDPASTSNLNAATFAGDVTAANFNSSSDETLKENIAEIQSALEIVQQLQGVSYNWKENNQKSYGFIAQQVEKIIPELVSLNSSSNTLTLNYQGFIPFLVESLKDQQKQIDELKSIINTLVEKINLT